MCRLLYDYVQAIIWLCAGCYLIICRLGCYLIMCRLLSDYVEAGRLLPDYVRAVIWLCAGCYLIMWRLLSDHVPAAIWPCGGCYLIMWRLLSDHVQAAIWSCAGFYLIMCRLLFDQSCAKPNEKNPFVFSFLCDNRGSSSMHDCLVLLKKYHIPHRKVLYFFHSHILTRPWNEEKKLGVNLHLFLNKSIVQRPSQRHQYTYTVRHNYMIGNLSCLILQLMRGKNKPASN